MNQFVIRQLWSVHFNICAYYSTDLTDLKSSLNFGIYNACVEQNISIAYHSNTVTRPKDRTAEESILDCGNSLRGSDRSAGVRKRCAGE